MRSIGSLSPLLKPVFQNSLQPVFQIDPGAISCLVCSLKTIIADQNTLVHERHGCIYFNYTIAFLKTWEIEWEKGLFLILRRTSWDYNHGQNKWKTFTPPLLPKSKMGKWRVLAFARLHPWFGGGDGGLLFHFILSKIEVSPPSLGESMRSYSLFLFMTKAW